MPTIGINLIASFLTFISSSSPNDKISIETNYSHSSVPKQIDNLDKNYIATIRLSSFKSSWAKINISFKIKSPLSFSFKDKAILES